MAIRRGRQPGRGDLGALAWTLAQSEWRDDGGDVVEVRVPISQLHDAIEGRVQRNGVL